MVKNVIIGEVDKVGKRNISGWVSKELDFNDAIRLVISGIVIRSHRADIEDPTSDDRRRFSFMIGDRLEKLLPKMASVQVLIGEKEFELPFSKGTPNFFEGHANKSIKTYSFTCCFIPIAWIYNFFATSTCFSLIARAV